MTTNDIVSALDAEIAHLQQVRALLVGTEQPAKRRPGRPKGSIGANPDRTVPRKRVMSAAGKARIAAAQRAR